MNWNADEENKDAMPAEGGDMPVDGDAAPAVEGGEVEKEEEKEEGAEA